MRPPFKVADMASLIFGEAPPDDGFGDGSGSGFGSGYGYGSGSGWCGRFRPVEVRTPNPKGAM